MDRLTERVLEYQATGDGLRDLVELLGPRVYRYPCRRHGSDEDDCGEFYLFFYPRLLRCLNRFRDQGKPFEWYLHAVLAWHFRAYRRRKSGLQAPWRAAAQRALWDASTATLQPAAAGAADETAAPPGASTEGWARLFGCRAAEEPLPSSAARKRLLFWALKQARGLDEAAVHWVCRLAGCEPQWLHGVAQRLRERLAGHEARFHLLYEKRNRGFCRLLHLQARALEQGPEASLLHQRLQRLRRGLEACRRKLARVQLDPSNRDIALVLGVPKGTVDTSLFWLRRRWHRSA